MGTLTFIHRKIVTFDSLLFKYISNFSSVELDKAYMMGKHVDLNNRLRISLTFYGNVWGSVYLP